ncbi:MAG: SbcC/MukB-like Walker B domain-containing protein, partial [Candidatus Sericytochromatia bacterium]
EIEKIDLENVNLEKKRTHYLQEYSKFKDIKTEKTLVEKSLAELEVKIKSAQDAEIENTELEKELNEVISKLESKNFNPELQNKIEHLEEELKNNAFSNEKFASIQSEVNSIKWSEIKYSQLEKYETDYEYLLKELPDLENNISELNNSLKNKLYAQEEYENLSSKEFEIEAIGYNKNEHQEINSKIESIKNFEDHWRSLQNALEKLPHLQEQKDTLSKNKNNLEQQIIDNESKVTELPLLQKDLLEVSQKIYSFNREKDSIRVQENNLRADIVRFTEKISQYEQMKKENEEARKKLETVDYEINLHKELVNAFGRKGIQAVIIENAIPEIEMYANKLLTRMTEGRMHVRFSTLKANKSNDKMSETLDIEISDELGTRSYEMYSGGESFRVNFAIRLALSKMLSRRSGTKLKTMVIDEGFGTQDSKGISRLIEAINTISDDFEKILIITHISELKEAFPSKIEVYKTINGSQVRLFT